MGMRRGRGMNNNNNGPMRPPMRGRGMGYHRDFEDRGRQRPYYNSSSEDRRPNRGRSRSRSSSGRSEGSRRSRSVDRRSRSVSRSPPSKRSSHSPSPAKPRSISSDGENKAHSVSSRSLSPAEEVKKVKKHKKEKKDKKKTRKRSADSSDEVSGSSDTDTKSKKKKRRPSPSSVEEDLRASLTAAKNNGMEMKTIPDPPQPPSTLARTLHNTIFKVDLTESGGPPQRQVHLVQQDKFNGKAAQLAKEKLSAKLTAAVMTAPPQMTTLLSHPPVPTVIKNETTPMMTRPGHSIIQPSSSSIVNARSSTAVFSDMRAIQQTVLTSVRTETKKPPPIPIRSIDEDNGGGGGGGGGVLKLSSFTKQISAESERDRKIAQLSPDLFEQLNMKRKQLEQAYKQDCETFGTVVKMLISKDAGLEERLLASLHDSLTEIGQKFVRQIDEHIDQLLLINT